VTGRSPRFLQILAILFLGLVFQPRPALAWNETGHRLVALVAWEALDEPARTAIIRLLKQHERFGADFGVAYNERLVRALLEAESDPARVLAPFEVDRDYGNAARRVAEGRVFEAGFRLAAMLRELIR
jgi:hypothetical protein